MNMKDMRNTLSEMDPLFPDSALLIYRPGPEQRGFLVRLLDLYAGAPQAERDEIENALRGRYGLLNLMLGCVYDAAGMIRSGGDAAWLVRGLTAAAIESSLGRVDERDRLLALAELWVTAEEAGLDPGPWFERICGLPGFSEYAVVRSRRRQPARETRTPDET